MIRIPALRINPPQLSNRDRNFVAANVLREEIRRRRLGYFTKEQYDEVTQNTFKQLRDSFMVEFEITLDDIIHRDRFDQIVEYLRKLDRSSLRVLKKRFKTKDMVELTIRLFRKIFITELARSRYERYALF